MRKQVFFCLAVLIVFELAAAHWHGVGIARGSSVATPKPVFAAVNEAGD
jgi:hypothetical protein